MGDREPIDSRDLDIGSAAGLIGRAMVVALSMPSFADIPLVNLPQKHKPTLAQ